MSIFDLTPAELAERNAEEAATRFAYNQMIVTLREIMTTKNFTGGQETMAGFVKYAKNVCGVHFEQANLYRCFSEANPQEMSLQTFVKICAVCGLGGERMRRMRVPSANISLVEFMQIDGDIIIKTLPRIQFYDLNLLPEARQ